MRPDYLVIGHVTADLTPTGRQLGGTVSYAARTASAFDLRVGALTSAAPGDPLLDDLRPFVQDLRVRPAEATSTFENIYEPGGRVQYIRGVAAPLSVDDVPSDWLAAPLVHLAPLTGEVDPRIAHSFRQSTVMLTLQGWLRRWDDSGRVSFKRWFDADILQAIDVVVFSEEDIREAPELERQFAQTVRHLFVTRAERGGTYYRRGEAIPFAAPAVEQIHPTGAGDVFASALLAALSRLDGDVGLATQVAAQLAAVSVTRVALDSAPTREEVERALFQVQVD